MGLLKKVACLVLPAALAGCLHPSRPPEAALDVLSLAVNDEPLEPVVERNRFPVRLCDREVSVQLVWQAGSVIVLMEAEPADTSFQLMEASVNGEGSPPAPEIFAYAATRPPLGDWRRLPQPVGRQLAIQAFAEGSSRENAIYHVRLLFECGGRPIEVRLQAALSGRKPDLSR